MSSGQENARAFGPEDELQSLRSIATAEGWIAVVCTIVVIVYPLSPKSTTELQWPFILAFALGIGFALGGIRHGKSSGRTAAVVALVFLLALLIAFMANAVAR